MRTLELNWSRGCHGHLESFWLLCRRFMARNCMPAKEVMRLCGRENSLFARFGFDPTESRIDPETTMRAFKLQQDELNATFPSLWELLPNPLFMATPFKYCVDCAQLGYHSVLHQVSWVRRCALHGTALSTKCQTCRRTIRSTSDSLLGQSAQTWPCGHAWTRAPLSRPTRIDVAPFCELASWIEKVSGNTCTKRWSVIELGIRNDDFDCEEHLAQSLKILATATDAPESVHRVLPKTRFELGNPVHQQISDSGETCLDETLLRVRGSYERCEEFRASNETERFRFHQIKVVCEKLGRAGIRGFVEGAYRQESIGAANQDSAVLKPQVRDVLASLLIAKYVKSDTKWFAEYPPKAHHHLSWWAQLFGKPLCLILQSNTTERVVWCPVRMPTGSTSALDVSINATLVRVK